ncbi:hypothetical protein [Terribacillus saccharophilus]|uniref:hypothetical protein n=1 Tax=Terribacillus saccharophilus TaxID=361277 RepID=UPI002989BAD6|nr:hypothetical protein [Terribacillus saccharophilus]MCM3227367.1 hypothetical protein [Terribacillus saccharophilus]
MELIKKIGTMIGYTALGIFMSVLFIYIAITSAKEVYSSLFPKSEMDEITVEGKIVYNDLFGNLTYYTAADEEAETALTIGAEGLMPISAEEYEMVQNGDVIDGETIQSFRLENLMDVDLFVNFLLFIAFSFIILFALVGAIEAVPVIGKKTGLLGAILKWVYLTLIIVGFSLVYISFGKSVITAIQAHSGEQIQTEAAITDSYGDPGSSRYESSYYYLALSYDDEQGNPIHMTKQVKPSIYYEGGSTIMISHPAGSPLNIHFGDTGSMDLFFYLGHLMMYILIFILTGLFILVAVLMRRHKKTGSYWKKKDKKQEVV